MPYLAVKLNIALRSLQNISESNALRIAHRKDDKSIVAEAVAAVTKAASYFGHSMDGRTAVNIATVICSTFEKRLTVDEIETAARLAATGELDLSDDQRTTFNRAFNVAFLSLILRKYFVYRDKKKASLSGIYKKPLRPAVNTDYWRSVAAKVYENHDPDNHIFVVSPVYELLKNSGLIHLTEDERLQTWALAQERVKGKRIDDAQTIRQAMNAAKLTAADMYEAAKLEGYRIIIIDTFKRLRADGVTVDQLNKILDENNDR